MKKSRNDTHISLIYKLTKRLLIVYTLIFVCVLILLFCILSPILYKKSVEQSQNATSIIASNFTQMSNTALSYLDNLASFVQLENLLKQYDKNPTQTNNAIINQYIHSYVSSFDMTLLIFVEAEGGKVFSSFNYANEDIWQFAMNNQYYQRLRDVSYGTYYSSINSEEILLGNASAIDKQSCFCISKKYYFNGNPYIMTIYYNAKRCLADSNKILKNGFNDYLVIDRNNTLIYTSGSLNSFNYDIKSTSGTIQTNDGVYFYETILENGWIVIAFSSWSKLFSNLSSIFLVAILLYFVSPVLYLIFVVPTNKQFLKPLKLLSDSISQYSVGQDIEVKITTGDEIEQLSHNFNRMVLKINQQIEDIKKQEHLNSVTKYMLLATQIDPHFINNTLHIISILARQHKYKDIIEVNTALNRITSERLNTKISIFETIEKEIETVKQYEVIMGYRYTNNVQLTYAIDPELLNQKIPKNILIPIVENAFFHGLTNEEGVIKGDIDILIYLLEDNIIIEISDSGRGIYPEMLRVLNDNSYQVPDTDRTHIGLSNIHERLSYVYGDHYKFEVKSTLGYGTTFIITLPLYNPDMETL